MTEQRRKLDYGFDGNRCAVFVRDSQTGQVLGSTVFEVKQVGVITTKKE